MMSLSDHIHEGHRQRIRFGSLTGVPETDPLRLSEIDVHGRIVRCAKCRQVWHTQAAYALDLPEAPIPTFLRRKPIRSADCHKGELPFPCKPAAAGEDR